MERPKKSQKRESVLDTAVAAAPVVSQSFAQFSLIGGSGGLSDSFFEESAAAFCLVTSIEPPGGLTGKQFRALFPRARRGTS